VPARRTRTGTWRRRSTPICRCRARGSLDGYRDSEGGPSAGPGESLPVSSPHDRALTRRRFLQAMALAAASTALPRPGVPRSLVPVPPLAYDDGSTDIPPGVAGAVERVIVIGAGFAGLAVANALGNA